MQALIHEGRVCQVSDTRFPVASPLQWVEAPQDVEPGWSYDGQTFTPPPEPPAYDPVPHSISAVQFRIQASRAGILDAIEAIIADPETDAEVKIAWEHAREFERASPTIEALRQHPSIDLSAEQVDDLFRAAAAITV